VKGRRPTTKEKPMSEIPTPEAPSESGGVQISDAVVAKIAQQALLKVEGVHALGASSLGVFSGLRGPRSAQGISVDLREDSADIDAQVVVQHGANIPLVGEACRVAVKEQVEAATGFTVRAVNIMVTDIYFPEQDVDDAT
jgi:uncharacterized alkaline shock family protein YloU